MFCIYEMITNEIIKKLEAGTVPWVKPWASGTLATQNLITKEPYKGINRLLTTMAGYHQPYFLSVKQINSLGGKVRKGERGHRIVFYKMIDKKDDKGNNVQIPFIQYSNVFNLQQTEGLEKYFIDLSDTENFKDFEVIENCESIVSNFKECPEIDEKWTAAAYSPSLDMVKMPNRNSFKSNCDFYSVLFHELVHSTGHEKRLNRHSEQKSHSFGSKDYSKEELIAEIGSVMLCGVAGVQDQIIDSSASYISGWLKALKDDKKLIFQASSKAQKAVEYIQGIKR